MILDFYDADDGKIETPANHSHGAEAGDVGGQTRFRDDRRLPTVMVGRP
jgi:hypothetical protein